MAGESADEWLVLELSAWLVRAWIDALWSSSWLVRMVVRLGRMAGGRAVTLDGESLDG